MKLSIYKSRARRLANTDGLNAFNRIDALATLFVVCVLAGFGAVLCRGALQDASATQCMSNLKLLGQATAMYSNQNDDKLPFGFIHYSDSKKLSWDTLISSYVIERGATNPAAKGMTASKQLESVLLCPSDKVGPMSFSASKPSRRTYAMTWHNMYAQNWPPGSNSVSGVGLWWAPWGGTNSSLAALARYSNGIPSVRFAMAMEPKSTILMTEQAQSNNLAGNSSGAVIRSITNHVSSVIPPGSYHDGRINYLMIDGHVDPLVPAKTVGQTGDASGRLQRGMWTLRPGD